mgnify:CR=1 FL=1
MYSVCEIEDMDSFWAIHYNAVGFYNGYSKPYLHCMYVIDFFILLSIIVVPRIHWQCFLIAFAKFVQEIITA